MFTTDKYGAFEIREFETVDSTQEEAKRLIRSISQTGHIANNIVIAAANQTSGRGRGNKEWISDSGNLFFSVIIDSKRVSPPEIISYIIALSVHSALTKNSVNSSIKWPNDIIIDGRKLCGMLIEKVGDFLIIGVGINISSSPEYLDSGRRACSLKDHEVYIDNKKLLKDILSSLEKELSNSGFENIRSRYIAHLYKFNEEVELDYLGKKVKGRIKDISTSGSLVLENETGSHEYRVGEIFDI